MNRPATEMPSDLFAMRLRQERERAEVSQTELARRISAILGATIDPSAVNRIEQRTRTVRLDEAVAAARALDVPLAMLLVEDPSVDNARQTSEYMKQLSDAEAQWARTRAEVDRLTLAVKALTEERIQIAQARPSATPPLDPELAEAIDARIPRITSEPAPDHDEDEEDERRAWSSIGDE